MSTNYGVGGRSMGAPLSLQRRGSSPWMALLLAEQNTCGVGGRSSLSYSRRFSNSVAGSPSWLGQNVGDLCDSPVLMAVPPRQDTIGTYDASNPLYFSKSQDHRTLSPASTITEAAKTPEDKDSLPLVSPYQSHDNSRTNSVGTLEEEDDDSSSSESPVLDNNNNGPNPGEGSRRQEQCSLFDLAEAASFRNLTETKRNASLSHEGWNTEDEKQEARKCVMKAAPPSRKRPRDVKEPVRDDTSSPTAEQRDVPPRLQAQPASCAYPSLRLFGGSGNGESGFTGIPLIPAQLPNGTFVLVPHHSPEGTRRLVSQSEANTPSLDDTSGSMTDKVPAHWGKRARLQHRSVGTANVLTAPEAVAPPNVLAAAVACAELRGGLGGGTGGYSGVGRESVQRQQQKQKVAEAGTSVEHRTLSATKPPDSPFARVGGKKDGSRGEGGLKDEASDAPGSGDDKRLITKVAYDDYLTGKGGHCVRHAGNRMVRNMIESLLSKYVGSTSNKEKSRIVDGVVQSVFGRGGRFLERSGESEWIELTQQRECRRRISQRFREVASGRSRTKSGRRRTTSTSFEYTPELPFMTEDDSHEREEQAGGSEALHRAQNRTKVKDNP